ncbi:hypothetical protein QUF64_05655 [Anaerolineales bacterium HSG6]|nr:hypothetical protein [Anaerolineales bacterium HSG6]
MSLEQENKVIWIVVLVESGVTTLVEAYFDENVADARQQILQKKIKPNNDDLGVFKVKIGKQDDGYIIKSLPA